MPINTPGYSAQKSPTSYNYNEISIKVNLIPNLDKKTIIDFNFFNFFFYNGKIFHKFVLTPNPDDEFADDRCKLFIYFFFNTNKSLCGNLYASFLQRKTKQVVCVCFSRA